MIKAPESVPRTAALIPFETVLIPSISNPESVSSSIANFG